MLKYRLYRTEDLRRSEFFKPDSYFNKLNLFINNWSNNIGIWKEFILKPKSRELFFFFFLLEMVYDFFKFYTMIIKVYQNYSDK